MSLSAKIISFILLALSLLLSGFGWITINEEKKVLQDLLDRQGAALAHAVATFSVESLLVEDFPVLETVLDSIGERTSDM